MSRWGPRPGPRLGRCHLHRAISARLLLVQRRKAPSDARGRRRSRRRGRPGSLSRNSFKVARGEARRRRVLRYSWVRGPQTQSASHIGRGGRDRGDGLLPTCHRAATPRHARPRPAHEATSPLFKGEAFDKGAFPAPPFPFIPGAPPLLPSPAEGVEVGRVGVQAVDKWPGDSWAAFSTHNTKSSSDAFVPRLGPSSPLSPFPALADCPPATPHSVMDARRERRSSAPIGFNLNLARLPGDAPRGSGRIPPARRQLFRRPGTGRTFRDWKIVLST